MNGKVLRRTMRSTTRITAMMMPILICSQVFSLAFRGLQGERPIHAVFGMLPGGVNADIWFLMVLIFVLGFFLERIEIGCIAMVLLSRGALVLLSADRAVAAQGDRLVSACPARAG